ncbi:DNA-binding transcriptional response regulator, NtrC family, contains REC, AAA-type ATPase, and a Fis-type DNA-binding domains [Aeromonas sp. RU39B]|uniref:sigma-54 dependent transcriptional regulator n=1 Tax=Aeromonas sp. RU39B TaxID=1907416 RepID=UPI000954694C|nr:sigma-54 dependent transcriptional regulator [Aeromonas sp. RU39B]SIR16309.1 DNA-binding transcriptional response regulator, NtrC family, contains REC, AAA-type ATPase, and a Fis-type DNA-binding domains [Aeromonas sp. RU39B]
MDRVKQGYADTAEKRLLWLDAQSHLVEQWRVPLQQAGWRVLHQSQISPSLGETAPTVIVINSEDDQHLSSLVTDCHRRSPQSLILVLVKPHQNQAASEALCHGALDYLHKPCSVPQLLHALDDLLTLLSPQPDMVVSSHVARQVIQLARRAANTDASVLITGESGTGKECLARFIHAHSARAAAPYVAINCAAIPENMLEAMLFGVAKGAYTGAVQSQPGKFELAQGGTLLLDEIGELPLPLQAKLLRVLQEREVERLGSHQRIALNVRILAASNRDLRAMVAEGSFRQDLFYRLDVLPLRWPALRERPADILPLAQHFIAKYAPDSGYQLGSAAVRQLLAYRWPGNVRELENVMQRALILSRGLTLQPEDLHLPVEGLALQPTHQATVVMESPVTAPTPSLHASKRQAEYQCVLDTLRRFDGHRTRTAEALGMTTRALRYKLAAMREQGINIDQLVFQ